MCRSPKISDLFIPRKDTVDTNLVINYVKTQHVKTKLQTLSTYKKYREHTGIIGTVTLSHNSTFILKLLSIKILCDLTMSASSVKEQNLSH